MAYRMRLRVDYDWVPDGVGTALLGQPQAENPGYGAAGGLGEVGAAQTCSDIVAEFVPNGDAAANADFQTALNAAAADLYTRFTTAGAVPGFAGPNTLSSVVLAWPSGGQ